ncbi:ATP-binding cassette domain-containing protein [Pseudonocardia humida]|uniref:ATP-binding cassette domain-containing protein n=1 Tax=Pseudonocardia humida TaxID=2800819 RepID=A0ABT0ZUM4_9PSEU|nr:ATP-binding cassette domain-containing protein [Pseudonocardia humida]MCO1654394.1 ATP-binding cassette domain-containing protein [Pseudonocardia humida]
MIEARGLTKRYGSTLAVDGLDFTVRPGTVTGFLGPNGAGKSTTMRMVLGLDRPSSGTVTVDGVRYADLPAPMHAVGALLDARAVHPGRTARRHLTWLARSNRIPDRRVDEVLELVGLAAVAHRRAGVFSLGMSQRLGIAAALLGDPGVLLFDEPVNGLDPEGIHWIRSLVRGMAAEGRTVLVSSHLLPEMALTADHLLVLGRGRLIADTGVGDLVAAGTDAVLVRCGDAGFATRMRAVGAGVRQEADGSWLITGMTAAEVGGLAALHGVALAELTPRRATLEEAFLELTRDSVEYPVGGSVPERVDGAVGAGVAR